jgi:DNA mismatch endonuclease (patch repair protein)
MMAKYDSQTELVLIKALKNEGEKFRTQVRKLPGTPDIFFPKQKLVVFVHGCFWHRHNACPGKRSPRNDWMRWIRQFNLQVILDQENYRRLRKRGYWVYVAWECKVSNNLEGVVKDIKKYLDQRRIQG